MNEINYKELLKKYIAHVIDMEGCDFIDDISADKSSPLDDEPFTEEEKQELKRLRNIDA